MARVRKFQPAATPEGPKTPDSRRPLAGQQAFSRAIFPARRLLWAAVVVLWSLSLPGCSTLGPSWRNPMSRWTSIPGIGSSSDKAFAEAVEKDPFPRAGGMGWPASNGD
jgi:hypothetical protein